MYMLADAVSTVVFPVWMFHDASSIAHDSICFAVGLKNIRRAEKVCDMT